MNDLDRHLDQILRSETSVGPRTLPAGTPRRVGRRHASLVAATFAGLVVGIALVVAVLGPLTDGGSAPPTKTPAAPRVPALGAPAPVGYVQPAGWPTIDFTNTAADVEAIQDDLVQPGISDVTVLAAGTVNDAQFAVVSYRGDDTEGMCGGVTLSPATDGRGISSGPDGGCTQGWFISVPAERDMLAETGFGSKPLDTFETFHAIVSHRVRSVQATMDDGTVATFPTIPGPPESPLDQVVIFAPFGLRGTVEALGADGTVLDHATICVPDQLGSGNYDVLGCTGSPAHL